MCMHILIKNSNTNLLHTHRCLYARMDTHNLSLLCVTAWQKAIEHTNNTSVWYSMPVLRLYSLFFLPLSSSSPLPSSFSPPWFGRGAASCAQALLLGHFCPTWFPTGLQAKGSNTNELCVALSQHILVSFMYSRTMIFSAVSLKWCFRIPTGCGSFTSIFSGSLKLQDH